MTFQLTICASLLALCAAAVEPSETEAPAAPVGAAVPLVAAFNMEPVEGQPTRLTDSGPLGLHGKLEGARLVPGGRSGYALKLDGPATRAVVSARGNPLAKLSTAISLTAWVRVDQRPAQGHARLFGHQSGYYGLKQGSDGNVSFTIFKGSWHADGPWSNLGPNGAWRHVAATFRQGDKVRLYYDGRLAGTSAGDFYAWSGDGDFVFGGEHWSGLLDNVRIYAAALTPEQVLADLQGSLAAVRAPAAADTPPPLYAVRVGLKRFHAPRSLDDEAQGWRRPGPDAEDWARMRAGNQELFADRPGATLYLPPRKGPWIRVPKDLAITPGAHWLRAIDWMWGRRYAYSTARNLHCDVERAELMVFPVRLAGDALESARQVRVSNGDQEVYTNSAPLRSLTLWLPQNEKGKPYQLIVDGRPPVAFEVGLKPVIPGDPRDDLRQFELEVPGPGPRLILKSLVRPEGLNRQPEWLADLKAMTNTALLPPPAPPTPAGIFTRHLGLTAPRSPLAVYAAALPHGMSGGGGFYFVNTQQESRQKAYDSADDYARFIAEMGYDRVIEIVNPGAAATPERLEAWAEALARCGVRAGVEPDTAWKRPYLAHPNLAFQSYLMPEWHAPLYRELQLVAQRLGRVGNFGGICLGADNAGYVPYWHWAPPEPGRPWGEAFTARFPERAAAGQQWAEPQEGAAFFEFVRAYDESWKQYGYFARGVAEVDPEFVTTTGSFGSSPGVFGRGGWPAGTVPGRALHEGLPVMQAYDWNEQSSSKPMHLVALLDRLRSDFPEKPAWALVDDFSLFLDHGTRQRAYALALTRGVRAIGTTFMPAPRGERAWPKIVAEQRDLYAWVHRLGGVYAMTEPAAPVGILYVHEQALLRNTMQDANTSEKDLIERGSHEGKTTEALFMCHAAGWPARLVTPEELKRGMSSHIKVLLLTGLDQPSPAWVWHAGLETSLRAFVKTGGRLLADQQSVSPLETVRPGLRIAAYVPQRSRDWTPELLARNTTNITRLREALGDLPRPWAWSEDPTLWAVPTIAGQTWYATVVNQAMEEETSADPARPKNEAEVAGHVISDAGSKPRKLVLTARSGSVRWNTHRPIYDVRLRQRLTDAQVTTVNLTQDAFQFYALPPAPVASPQANLTRDAQGYHVLEVQVGPPPMTGIPFETRLHCGTEEAVLYGVTGQKLRLPIGSDDPDARVTVGITELLSGLSVEVVLQHGSEPAAAPTELSRCTPSRQADAIRGFARRKSRALVVALTPAQAAQPEGRVLGDKLVAFYQAQGRRARLGGAEPGDVVLQPQPFEHVSRYPRWQTEDCDVVLLGTARDNLLIYDQARANLLPWQSSDLPAGEVRLSYTWSPFVGEYDAVNVLARDLDGLRRGVELLTTLH